uniref:Uncharacterized protein n=1 Tax=Cacopsylla melanoneura TaxID=428564 RepID=A0A8D8SQN2_9HEMI
MSTDTRHQFQNLSKCVRRPFLVSELFWNSFKAVGTVKKKPHFIKIILLYFFVCLLFKFFKRLIPKSGSLRNLSRAYELAKNIKYKLVYIVLKYAPNCLNYQILIIIYFFL